MKYLGGRRDILLVSCLLLVNALALFPLLTSGYFADDTLNSQIRGHMIETGRSLWGVTSYYALLWLKSEGRLFPLAFYVYSVFYVLKSIIVYKLCVMGMVLASVGACFVFLRRLSGGVAVPAITALLLPIAFQFRAIWDPILAFGGQYPLLCFLLFCSLTLFLKSLDEPEPKPAALAIVLFLCCGLIFEVAYLMCLVYIVVAFTRLKSVRAALRAAAPFVAVSLALAVVSLALRSGAAPSATYTPNLAPAAVVRAYFAQIVGAVPFSYGLLDPQRVFAGRIEKWPAAFVEALAPLALLAALIIWTLRRRLSEAAAAETPGAPAALWVVGALLVGIPPALISLSPRYQMQPWGDAYLPVYLSCFGVCLLGAIGLIKLYSLVRNGRRNGPWLLRASLGVWLLLFAFNLRDNWLVVQAVNEAVWEPRVLVERALKRGLLKGVGGNGVVLVRGADPWDNAAEYCEYAGRKLEVFKLSEAPDLTPSLRALGAACSAISEEVLCDLPADAPVYGLEIRHLTAGAGAVLLSHVRRSVQRGGSIHGVFANEVLAYFQMPPPAQALTAAVAGRYMSRSVKDEAAAFRATDRGAVETVAEGRDWKLVRLRRESVFDALSLRGEISVERTGSSMLMAKDRHSFELHAEGPELLHVGYLSRDLGNGVAFAPLTLGRDVSIELLVTPGESQAPYADILSNHGGDDTGFCIEQLGSRTNEYSVSFGSGKGWMEVGTLALTPGRRSYISLQRKGSEASLYVDGAAVAHKTLPADVAESPHPLHIGNWLGEDRPFNGWVEEVLISRGEKSEATVAQESRHLAAPTAPGAPVTAMLLKGGPQPLVHEVPGDGGRAPFALPAAFAVPESFTLELLVRPEAFQLPYATIISNHPGKNGYQGMTIEEPAGKTNWYNFAMGNGKSWMPSDEFFLSPERLHYLVVTKEKRLVKVYVDGRSVSNRTLEADLAASEFPLMVGNWSSQNRRFNGAIQEIRISPSVASSGAVAEQADALRKALAP